MTRRIATLVAFSFICTFVLPLNAIAQNQNAKQLANHRSYAISNAKPIPRLIPPPKSLRENLKPLTKQQIALLKRNNKSTISHLSIIDSVGHPLRRVFASEFKQWQNRLKSRSINALESAHLNLLIGETLLARDEQPEEARTFFTKAAKITTHFTNYHPSTKISHYSDLKAIQGIAAYDNSLALFYAGRYAESADAMKHLLKAKPAIVGFSRSEAALFAKHAAACAGYHAERAKMGIVEPAHLEPLCGIEAIAARLQALHRPFDKKTVLPLCRYTGEGSNLQDLVDATKRLKLTPTVFKADDEGLKALPKPLVAFCEHDHYISVTEANAKGVSYLCADCGSWPGGKQTVTWKQWHMMECGPYLTLTISGSDEDEGLKLAITDSPTANQSRISLADLGERSMAGSVRLAGAQGQFLSAAARLSARLKGHALVYVGLLRAVVCGSKSEGNHCPGQVTCPTDNGCGDSGGKTITAFGASSGDPVNLATGEEEYAPPTDLSVYNPIGPSVSISRIYNNSALVTFSRDISTGNITAVNDRYNRSIYYHTGTYSNANIPQGWTQTYQEIDHVSQIVTTGTATPPDRYAYGYQDVNNGENNEQVIFLHTITVPSPTGAGNATATINYATDGTGYVTSVVDANSNSRNYSVTDATHTKVTVKDPANNIVYAYTANFDANMSGVSTTNGSNVIQATKYFSDPNDPYRPSLMTDANNRTTQASWDQFGNCLSMLSARGITTSYAIDYTHFALGEVTQVQQGSKTATSLTYYEPSGLIHTFSTPLPGTSGGGTVTSSFVYDSLGNVLSETGPGNNAVSTMTTTFSYTTDGAYSQNAAIMQPLKATDNLGHSMHYRYDIQGRRVAMSDALSNESDTQFNIAGQPLQTILPATGQTGTGHSGAQIGYLYPGGPQMTVNALDESGNAVRQIATTYGPEMEILSTTGITEPVQYAYDALYRRTSIKDNNNSTTLCSFTASGYLSTITHPGGSGTYQYSSYDSLGNMLQRIDGRSIVTNYLYSDAENKLTDIQYPASTTLNVHLHYDNYGRMDSISDSTGSRAVTYDDMNKPLTTTTTYTGLPAQTITNGYYPNGSLSSISTPGGSFSYSFDAAGRFTGLTNPFNENFSWSYLDNNWIWKQTSGSVLTSTSTYNSLGQLQELDNQKQDLAHTILSDYQNMSYDGVGNRVSMSANVPSYAQATFNSTYQYDGRSELTQENGVNYGYDAAGNMNNNRGMSFSYNSANQITTAVTDHNQTAQHDLNGNQTSALGITSSGWANIACNYDAENRMTAYGSSFTAGYLAEGLRAWKQTASGRTYYLYGGGIAPMCELDSSGNVTAVNTAGAEGLLSRHTASGSVFYAFDARGDTANRLDSSGNLLNSSTYSAFGSQTSNAVTSNDPYDGFAAQFGASKDVGAATIYLCGQRYYSPDECRWLNRDPIWYEGGLNLYGYVKNNPETHIDIFGTSPDLALPGGGIIGGGAVIGGGASIGAIIGEIGAALAACIASVVCIAIIAIIAVIGLIACIVTHCYCAILNCNPPQALPIERCDPIDYAIPLPRPDDEFGLRCFLEAEMHNMRDNITRCYYICNDGMTITQTWPGYVSCLPEL